MHTNPERAEGAVERENLRCDEKSLISIQFRSGHFDVRRNQVAPAELKRSLLKDTSRLQFRAVLSNALHRLSIQLARLDDAVRLQ